MWPSLSRRLLNWIRLNLFRLFAVRLENLPTKRYFCREFDPHWESTISGLVPNKAKLIYEGKDTPVAEKVATFPTLLRVDVRAPAWISGPSHMEDIHKAKCIHSFPRDYIISKHSEVLSECIRDFNGYT